MYKQKSPYIFDQERQSKEIVLYAFDTDFNLKGIITNYISVAWEEDYNNRGKLLLVCVDSPENIALLQMSRYIARKEKDTAMVIRYVKHESQDSRIIVQGYTTNDIIRQRVIYRTKSVYNVESAMYSMVNDNIRGIPYFSTAPPAGIPGTFETQFTGTNLLEANATLSKEVNIGFMTKFDHRNKKHVFTVYQGKDLSYGNTVGNPYKVFSPEFKNLVSAIIIDDMSIFANVAYVAGAGEGEERIWVEVGAARGLDRFEIFVDARDLQRNENQTETQYIQLLIARGIQKLNEHIRVKTFIGEVDPLGFGSAFNLGDIITCKSDKYGIRINTRILHYAEVREQNITKLKLTLGEPEINLLKVVKL